MTYEEIQRAMEFIIRQQAQYAARLEKDESRLASLEQSFKLLVELARGIDDRLDTLDGTMLTLSHSMNELAQRSITDKMRLARLENAFTRLAELAHKHE